MNRILVINDPKSTTQNPAYSPYFIRRAREQGRWQLIGSIPRRAAFEDQAGHESS
jgi:hypothetical protein